MRAISKTVSDNLGYYVYRLIDPRTGHTFYVGKGRGGRVYEHVLAQISVTGEENESSLKLAQIRDIPNFGMEPHHIIHRHGLDERTAYEVEAAVIDCYMNNLTNVVSGHNSDRGSATVDQLIQRYEPEEMPNEPGVPIL